MDQQIWHCHLKQRSLISGYFIMHTMPSRTHKNCNRGNIMRQAYCSCRQLAVVASGEPLKVSVCHCRECQRRTGSAFGVAVFYKTGQVATSGNHQAFMRLGDSGKKLEFRFCPACGSTVYWIADFRPDLVAVALGCFEDPSTVWPTQSVYETTQLAWVSLCLQHPGKA